MILNKPQASQIKNNDRVILSVDKSFHNVAGVQLNARKGSVIKIIGAKDDYFEFIASGSNMFDNDGNRYGSNVIAGAIELVQGDFEFVDDGAFDMQDGVAGMEEMLGSVVAGDELTVLKYKNSEDYDDPDQGPDNNVIVDDTNMFGDPIEGDEMYEDDSLSYDGSKRANELNDKPEPPKMGKIPDRLHNPKEDIAGKKTASSMSIEDALDFLGASNDYEIEGNDTLIPAKDGIEAEEVFELIYELKQLGFDVWWDEDELEIRYGSKKTANVPDDSEIVGPYGDVYGTLTLKDGSTIAFNGEQGSFNKFVRVDPKTIASHGDDVYVERTDGTKILLDSVGAVEDFIENNRTGSKKVKAYFNSGDMIKKIQDVDDKPHEIKTVFFDHATQIHMYDVQGLGKITDAEIEQYQKVGKSETPSIWQPGKNKRDDPSKHGYEGEAQPKDLKKLPRKS